MAGKGSARRPAAITPAEYADRHAATFGHALREIMESRTLHGIVENIQHEADMTTHRTEENATRE